MVINAIESTEATKHLETASESIILNVSVQSLSLSKQINKIRIEIHQSCYSYHMISKLS
jgi:hypothetical protein